MENEKQPEQSRIDEVSQPITHCSYTSRFFGNYLDNSLIDVSGSELSLSKHEEDNDPVDSIQQVKAEGLVRLGRSFKRRTLSTAIEAWKHEKERIVRLQRKTPLNIAKLLMKICMLVNVKIKSKCHMFLSKIKKMPKRTVPQLQPPVATPIEPKKAVQEGQNKRRNLILGYIKITEISQRLQIKYFNPSLQQYSFQVLLHSFRRSKLLDRMQELFQCQYEQTLLMGWRSIQQWLNYCQKVEILVDTMKLIVHQQLRAGQLGIMLAGRSEPVEPSYISSSKSRISSIRSKSQSKISLTQFKQFEASEETNNNNVESVLEDNRQCFFKKQSEPERQYIVNEITANQSKLKLHKYQTSPSQEYNSQLDRQRIFANQIQTFSVRSQGPVYPNDNDMSVSKPMQTPSSSLISPRAQLVLKKPKPLKRPELKSYKVSTTLDDNDFSITNRMQRGIFNNITQVIRSRPLKNDDLHHDLTDFNDLFFARQILNFYLIFDPPAEVRQQLPSNQNLYNLSQEDYSFLPSENGSRTRLSRKGKQHTVASETFIGAWNRLSLEDRSAQRLSQYQAYPQTCHYLSPPQHPIRHNQLKIPSQLPKNFDYYANKSGSRKSDKKSLTKSDQATFLYQKVRQVANSVSKNRIFNIVKAGATTKSGLRLGEAGKRPQEGERRSKKSIDRRKSKGKDQLNTSRKSKSRQKDFHRSPEETSREKCEYMMSFRGCPPKKKMRKLP